MNCPFCNFHETKVVDSRPTDEGQAIRRRRECLRCLKRFTTYEKMEKTPLIVIKKDGNRQLFDRNKILNGILKACEKRPVPLTKIEEIVDEIEKELYNLMEKEVTSEMIGQMVMDKLKEVDEVSYVRFASVYRQFKDINTFMDELKKLLNEENGE